MPTIERGKRSHKKEELMRVGQCQLIIIDPEGLADILMQAARIVKLKARRRSDYSVRLYEVLWTYEGIG